MAPKGHFQGGAGFEIGVPVGTLDELITVGRDLADKVQSDQPLTDDEKWRLFDVGINLALNPPSVGPHVGLAYTVIEHLELNLRYAGAVIRFGGRYQLLDHVTGPFDMVTGLGIAHDSHGVSVSVPELEDIVRVDEFSRWRIDVPLLIGTSRDWVRVWAGPRFLYSWFDAGLSLNLQNEHPLANLTGNAVYFGGQAGVAVGYRKLFFAVELTMAQVWGTAHLTTSAISPGTHDSALSTFVVYPSIGLIAEL